LDCGRKPEHLEQTHADTGKMCKLHTDSHPRPESNPSPWICEVAVLTTVEIKALEKGQKKVTRMIPELRAFNPQERLGLLIVTKTLSV